jgi:hypothetical protein
MQGISLWFPSTTKKDAAFNRGGPPLVVLSTMPGSRVQRKIENVTASGSKQIFGRKREAIIGCSVPTSEHVCLLPFHSVDRHNKLPPLSPKKGPSCSDQTTGLTAYLISLSTVCVSVASNPTV